MRTKSLPEALTNLAEEAAELAAAAARAVNNLAAVNSAYMLDVEKQMSDVRAVWREIRPRLRVRK